MQKVLNQEEIDAMFRAARSGAAGAAAVPVSKPQLTVTRCNLQGSPLRKEQVRAISALHETFARNVTHSLGAYLRVLFEVNLVSVEQLLYREFLGRVPDLVYLASLNLAPEGGLALLQMDLSLAFVVIDLLLGGQGQAPTALRDLTEIEDQILENVVRVLCRELNTTWQSVGVAVEFDERQQATAVQHLMPPTDKALALSFEIRMADARGALNFVFPASASTVLLRKLARDWSQFRAKANNESEQRLREALLNCDFSLELALPSSDVPFWRLLELEAGDVLVLPLPATTPADLRVAKYKYFEARPVRAGTNRGAQILNANAVLDASREVGR
ncbi:MAG TPA: flagellar motor switch protein FliM [Terriglobales bacterium]|nr:flagellar motor switch protein FliM [Terriglobales bacterium]